MSALEFNRSMQHWKPSRAYLNGRLCCGISSSWLTAMGTRS